MIDTIDESYVMELLRDVPKGLSREQFMAFAQPDINGGWVDEVEEAWRRYQRSAG